MEDLHYCLLETSFLLIADHVPIWLHTMKDMNAKIMHCYLAQQLYRFQVTHRANKAQTNINLFSQSMDTTPDKDTMSITKHNSPRSFLRERVCDGVSNPHGDREGAWEALGANIAQSLRPCQS